MGETDSFDPSRDVIVQMAYAIEAKTITPNGPSLKEAMRRVERRGGPSPLAFKQARAALSIVSRWLGERAIRYDREADLIKDGGVRKLQGATLAVAANELGGHTRLPNNDPVNRGRG